MLHFFLFNKKFFLDVWNFAISCKLIIVKNNMSLAVLPASNYMFKVNIRNTRT